MADVMLEDAGRNKIAVIRVIREFTRLGLKEAKDLADGAPRAVLTGVDATTAAAMVQALQTEGARARIDSGAATTAGAIWDDAAPAGGMSGAGGGVSVVLLSAGSNKIAVIKVIRELTGWGLKEAKDCADAPSQVVVKGQSPAAAEAARSALQAVGAQVELRRS